MPNRNFSSPAYRYGFQGQEKDDEIKGEGNSLNYTFRMHDPRVGRFFAVDPLQKAFHWNSSYAFSENRVMDAIELEGAESVLLHGTLAPGQEAYDLWDEEKYPHMVNFAKGLTGNSHHLNGTWNGRGESSLARKTDAYRIALEIIKYRKDNNLIKEPILVLGHSHGGNVAIEVINLLENYYLKQIDKIEMPELILVTLNTPKVWGVNVNNNNSVKHYNIYAENDIMSTVGQTFEQYSVVLGQEYKNADMNISYEDQTEGVLGTWNHMGFTRNNFNEWKPKFDKEFQELQIRARKFIEDVNRNYKKKATEKINSSFKTKKDNTDVNVSASPRYFK